MQEKLRLFQTFPLTPACVWYTYRFTTRKMYQLSALSLYASSSSYQLAQFPNFWALPSDIIYIKTFY